jgi:hypothetical protein
MKFWPGWGITLGLIFWSAFTVSAQWFNPQRPDGSLSAADSLAAFRPDSLDAAQFNRLESGAFSAQDTAKIKADSLKKLSSAQLFTQRKIFFAAHLGVGFQDLGGSEHFAADLDARTRARSGGGRVLQPYEPVHLYFPAGLMAAVRVLPYADAVLKTHSFWYQQSGLIGDSLSGPGQEEFFALQGHLAGLGMRLYIPSEILSARNFGPIYGEVVRYWDVMPAEIYTPHGSVKASRQALGSATEFQVGFLHELATPWTWGGALSFFVTNWASSKRWNEFLQVTASDRVNWGGNALQFRFFLYFNPLSNSPSQASNPSSIQPAKP